jgi:hypothetical protein
LQTLFDIMLRAISFKIAGKYSFPILTFIHIYVYCVMGHLLVKYENKICSDLGRYVSQQETSKILLYVISFLHAVHTSRGCLDTLHRTYHSTLHSLACNKLEVSGT